MGIAIVGLYAAMLFVIAAVLAAQAGFMRGKTGISVMYGDNMELALAMRRHANFTEHVPLALILLSIIALNGASAMLLHALGILLVVARIIHPIGFQIDDTSSPLRGLGAGGTLLVTLIAAVVAVWQFVRL